MYKPTQRTRFHYDGKRMATAMRTLYGENILKCKSTPPFCWLWQPLCIHLVPISVAMLKSLKCSKKIQYFVNSGVHTVKHSKCSTGVVDDITSHAIKQSPLLLNHKTTVRISCQYCRDTFAVDF
jgi:hypothetical protein